MKIINNILIEIDNKKSMKLKEKKKKKEKFKKT